MPSVGCSAISKSVSLADSLPKLIVFTASFTMLHGNPSIPYRFLVREWVGDS